MKTKATYKIRCNDTGRLWHGGTVEVEHPEPIPARDMLRILENSAAKYVLTHLGLTHFSIEALEIEEESK